MKTANRIVMSVAGVLFLFAAVMKSYQLLTEPIISKGFWESWEFFILQVPLEIGLGIWLLSGLFRKAGWLAAVIAFAGFIVITLQKGITGAESCGCFGTFFNGIIRADSVSSVLIELWNLSLFIRI